MQHLPPRLVAVPAVSRVGEGACDREIDELTAGPPMNSLAPHSSVTSRAISRVLS